MPPAPASQRAGDGAQVFLIPLHNAFVVSFDQNLMESNPGLEFQMTTHQHVSLLFPDRPAHLTQKLIPLLATLQLTRKIGNRRVPSIGLFLLQDATYCIVTRVRLNDPTARQVWQTQLCIPYNLRLELCCIKQQQQCLTELLSQGWFITYRDGSAKYAYGDGCRQGYGVWYGNPDVRTPPRLSKLRLEC